MILRVALAVTVGLVAVPGLAKVDPYAVPDGAYEQLFGCYSQFLERKGLREGTPPGVVKRWEVLARKHCDPQFRRFAALVGRKKAESEWNSLLDEYWSRL